MEDCILEVSRAVSNETLSILYEQNNSVVDINGDGYLQFLEFSVANLQHVHYLRDVARPMGVS